MLEVNETFLQIGGAVLFFVTISTALWAVWNQVVKTIDKSKTESFEAIDRAKIDAQLRAEAIAMRAELVAKEFAEYRTHVAETYITKQGMKEFRDEMTAGFRDIKTSISGMNERMDRVIEASHKPTPSRRST